MANDTDTRSISDRLAAFGITHQPGDSHGRRHLSSKHGPLGLADAHEACNLLALLEGRQ